MRAKDVAKEHDWGSRFEVRDCPADLAADTDIPVVLTMLSNATGGSKTCTAKCLELCKQAYVASWPVVTQTKLLWEFVRGVMAEASSAWPDLS
jgi:hypothetical protein